MICHNIFLQQLDIVTGGNMILCFTYFLFKHLVLLCASSSHASEDRHAVCWSSRTDCSQRAFLQCDYACVFSEHQPEWLNSRNGHT